MTNSELPIELHIPVRGLRLYARQWQGTRLPFVLAHGLSSNARTWDGVAARLSQAGHRVVAYDQRGHGRSDKPDSGYGFDDVTADLLAFLGALDIERPVLVGQSWGGNVVLDFAARHPGHARGLVLVDGGFIELASRPDATWERISVELRPPDLDGMRRVDIEAYFRSTYAGMTDHMIESVMGNFEILPDGTIRRRLSIANHMRILRSLWEHRPSQVYPNVTIPVLIAVPADTQTDRGWRRMEAIGRAEAGLEKTRVAWFEGGVHDLHVHSPDQLASVMLAAAADGFFD